MPHNNQYVNNAKRANTMKTTVRLHVSPVPLVHILLAQGRHLVYHAIRVNIAALSRAPHVLNARRVNMPLSIEAHHVNLASLDTLKI